MVACKAIPETVQWIIVRLSSTMSVEDVAMYTDVGQRTVKKILSHFQQTGGVIARKSTEPPALCQSLCDDDVGVSGFSSVISFGDSRKLLPVHVCGYH